MKHTSKKTNWLKHVLQWGTLAAIVVFVVFGEKIFGKPTNVEAYCPFGGLQSLGAYLQNETLACTMSIEQIMIGIALAVGVILFGKLFCGYICPLGTVGEYIGKLGKKIKVQQNIKSESIADRALRIVKYALLFLVLYNTVSSSELFCHIFDPYYATATGFKGEIVLTWAIVAVAVYVIGNLFVKQFWCRYLCPLGALSNIFRFIVTFIAIILVWWVLSKLGLNISWVVALAVTCVISYIFEIIYLKSKVSPFLYVVRDSETCTNCRICSVKCPQAINVFELNKVRHIDCTLCGNCVSACPENSLKINGKSWRRWVPGILAVVLFALALVLGNMKSFELPTINMRWNTVESDTTGTAKISNADLKSFEMDNLLSVKCYGSSMAFKAKLQKIRGVHGVETYTKDHHVIIYYNPAEVDEEKIQSAVFTPTKFRIETPDANVDKIKVITIRTEKMFDRLDANRLGMQFRNTGKKYYGLESEFACPLIVRLYMDVNEPVDEEFLRQTVEKKILHVGKKDYECNFTFVKLEPQIDTIALRPYLERMFSGFKAEFKKQADLEGKKLAIYEIENADYEKPIIMRNLPFLSNHTSQLEGVVGVYLVLNERNLPAIQIKYDTDVCDADKIWNHITKDTWHIVYKKDEAKDESAKIKFKQKGVVKEIQNN